MVVKEFIRVCFVLSISLSMVYGGENPLSQTAKSKGDKIIAKFRERGQGFSESSEVIRAFTPDSVFAERIIFIRGKNKCPLVAKIFKDENKYREEKDQLVREQKYVGIVNGLRKKCIQTLPILMEYKGSSKVIYDDTNVKRGVVLLSKAAGETLESIVSKFNIYDDDKIIDMFRKIGEQLGQLDSLFALNKVGLLRHPDSHWGNFMYDDNKKQLYWIDTAGLELRSDILPGLGHYRFPQNLREEIQKEFMIANDYDVSPDTFVTSVDKLHKLFLALKSLYKGYMNQARQNNLDTTNITNEYNKSNRMFSGFEEQIYEKIEEDKLDIAPIKQDEFTLKPTAN